MVSEPEERFVLRFPWFGASPGSPREFLRAVREERQTLRFPVFRESGRVGARASPSFVSVLPGMVSVGATH